MKVAVLVSREDRSHLAPVLETLKALGLPSFGLSIAPGWIDQPREKVCGLLRGATHLNLIVTERCLADSWFGYAVGYGTRLSGGISILRQAPGWSPQLYLRGFPLFEDIEELSAWFAARGGEWTTEERRDSARRELLDRGISCTVDSFAQRASEGDAAAIKLFLNAGFDPDTKDRHGVTMLCLAVRNRHLGAAEALLEVGAAIDLKSDDRGYAPLMDAVQSGPVEHVAYFLERGADPNLESKDGQTALVIAVGRKDIEGARLLLEHGADPDNPDKLGMSARSYAKLFKLPEFAALFAEYPPLEPD